MKNKTRNHALKAIFASTVASIGLAACVAPPQQAEEFKAINIPGAPNRNDLPNPTPVQPPSQVTPFPDLTGDMLRHDLRLECLREFNQHRGDRDYRYRGECHDFVQDPYYRRNFDQCYDRSYGWDPRCEQDNGYYGRPRHPFPRRPDRSHRH